MSKNHKVIIHLWIDGILKYTERSFDQIENALSWAKERTSGHIKVYHKDGQIVHEQNGCKQYTSDY